MAAARDASLDAVEVWGSGTATREFLFVRDAADGIARAADRYNEADPVNLGSGQEVSIAALAALVKEACGFRGELRWNPDRPSGQPRRCVDTTRRASGSGSPRGQRYPMVLAKRSPGTRIR